MKKILSIIIIAVMVLSMAFLLSAQTSKDIIVTPDGKEQYRSQRVAVIVGINDYSNISDLKYAVADATLVKDTLEEQGNFTVEFFHDDSPKAPSAYNIMKSLRLAVSDAKYSGLTTFVFYFSGHGFRADNKNYLAPREINPDRVAATGISLDEVLEIMEEIKQYAKVMIFMDACRNDVDGAQHKGASVTWKDNDSSGLGSLYSTSEGEYSWELGDKGHGIYTYYLNEGLQGNADEKPAGNEDGFVSFLEVSRYVFGRMRDWSRTNEHGHTQTPRMDMDQVFGEFYITATGKKPQPKDDDDTNIAPVEDDDFQPRPRIHPDLESVSYRDMVYVDGGTFTQITDETDDSGGFRHTISSFEIGKYEVTYELWYTVYQWAIDNGYKFANKGREGHNGTDGAKPKSSSKHEPVTEVNWRDTIVWCNAYSEMCNKSPVYLNSSGKVIKDSRDSNGDECDSAEPDWDADGYRLPTEGEWQFAASDREDTPYDYASGASDDYGNSSATKKVAWYRENSDWKTHDVGTKRANDLGLYDMSGNVYEWCWDWYDDLPTSSATDYRNSTAGSDRVIRGGSWYIDAKYLRVGFRYDGTPSSEDVNVGFRLARQLP